MTYPSLRRIGRTLTLTAAGGLLAVAPSIAHAQQVQTTDVPKTHTVKKGDTLWDLAQKYLNDPFRWPEIYRLNTDIVQDPHWIYPNEVLKLPGYVAVALPGIADSTKAKVEITPVTPSPLDTARVSRPAGVFGFSRAQPQAGVSPTVMATNDTAARPAAASMQTPMPTVRYGDYLRAPWVDNRKGPLVWGRILGAADLPGIDVPRQLTRFQLNDRILIAPPTGSVAPEKDLYLAYHNGPTIEGFGQVIVPTGVVEVIRPPVNGDAAIARVIQMFGEVNERDRLMLFDSSVVRITGQPVPVKNGREGTVRWILDEPVLPAPTYFIILTLSSQDAVKPGDEVEIVRPRKKAADEGLFGTPEVYVARAQIIRVTAEGSTAMIKSMDQPKIEAGMIARVVAKMQ
jgi:LysM repeat protein